MSLAGFAAAAKTTNVAGRAVEPGSQAERPGLDSVWLAGRTSCPQQRFWLEWKREGLDPDASLL